MVGSWREKEKEMHGFLLLILAGFGRPFVLFGGTVLIGEE